MPRLPSLDSRLMILNVEIVKRIDLYKKKISVYKTFLELIEESILRENNSSDFVILAKDILHEKLKRVLIENFNLKKFTDKVKEIYSEMMQHFPKCLTKQLVFDSSDF
jgi:hypothetical protein